MVNFKTKQKAQNGKHSKRRTKRRRRDKFAA